VLALVDRQTGEVRSRVVPDVTAKTLRKALAADVDMPSTVLHTDGFPAYVRVAPAMAGHESVGPQGRRLRAQWRDDEHGRDVLQLAQAQRGRHSPPRQRQAPAPLPGRIRLPLQHAEAK
jgi:hypothetical protein